MSKHTVSSKIAISAFGVASATLYMSPSAEASVINLTPNIVPNSVAFPTTIERVRIDLGIAEALGLGTADKGFDFALNNDLTVGKGVFNFQTIATSPSTIYTYGNIEKFVFLDRSNILSTQNSGLTTQLKVSAGATGTQFVGFQTGVHVGWFQLDWGGFGGAVTILAAAIESEADTPIHIPEPSTLGLGALGLLAAGASRRRKRSGSAGEAVPA